MKQLDFIYFDAGGGHRAAANALREVIARQQRPWEVRLVNLQEQLEHIDVFHQLTRIRMQDIYNRLLEKGWTLGTPQIMVGMHLVIRLFHRRQVRALRELWRNRRPDLVVSLIPNFNRALAESLQAELPTVPLVTILTDIADYPPHFWLEPVEQFIVCGSDYAVGQARAMGHPRERIHLASGMILNPAFYDTVPLDDAARAAARAALGFDPAEPVGLVLFGGHGSGAMLDIARLLPHRQLLLICGHNEALAGRLRKLPHAAPMFVEGFSREVQRYMQLADYFIGKPGPGSLSEAVHMHLPVIVERNAWTLPQERYNAEWIREKEIGIVLASFHAIAGAVDAMLAAERYRRFRDATKALQNRAVFEIPDVLEKILEAGTAARLTAG